MSKKNIDIIKLARVELIVIPIFTFFKYIRPSILKSKAPDFFKISLLSLPNFFEAIIGVLTLTGVILLINDGLSLKHQVKPKTIYKITVVLAAIYVILQELNIIKIRTNTTFDPNDIIFSVIGLITAYLIIISIKPRIR